MATVNKDFKIKSGLVVEGTTGTINGLDILTKKQADQDYIVGLIGGTATSENTPNTVVKRDADGNFAASDITVNEISIEEIGRIYEDDSDLIIENIDGSDVVINAEDIRLNSTDDIRLNATGDVVIGSTTGHIRFEDGPVHIGFPVTAENEVATRGTVDSLIGDNTVDGTSGNTVTDRIATALSSATQAVTDHNALTTGVHGVTGSVVGTTDTQDISNKRIIDTLYFTDGVTINNEAEIEVQSGSHVFNVQANLGDLNLKTVATGASVYVISDDADIVLAADGGSYIGTVAAENEIATKGYADGVAGDVASDLSTHEQATTGVHGVTGNIVGTTDTQTLSNKTLGSDLAAGGYKVSGLADPTADQDSATKAYVDDAIANLVDSAPAALDTLNELAAALGDDVDMVTGLATSIGNKVAKAGDSMSGDLDFGGTNKVTSLAAPTNSGDAANKLYVDTEISDLDTAAQGYADDAETAANLYTDGRETAITTAYQSYADTAEQDAKDYADDLINDASNLSTQVWSAYKTGTEIGVAQTAAEGFATGLNNTTNDRIDDLTTSDIPEGSNLYFTDYAAKVSAVDLLTNATQNNIEITWSNPTGLVITAENGVADSTTADLAEDPAATSTSGTMYFTDSRALGAISGENIQPESIDITWVRREEATWTDVPTASKATCHSAGTNEGSMKYLVRVTASVGGTRHSHVTEVLATVDGSNGVAVVEYGTIYTSTEPLATVTVEWNASTSKYDLNVTTANNSSEVMVAATLMATLD
jgi:hypothetical protein